LLISFFSIFAEATLHLVLRLRGGKKKKKKVFTKPKKNRHRKKKVPLAALKYYRIDGNTVTRLRPECPSCGPSVFMAVHKDRVHCGKCGRTKLPQAK